MPKRFKLSRVAIRVEGSASQHLEQGRNRKGFAHLPKRVKDRKTGTFETAPH